MAEFLLKKPLFPGKGELDQLSKIFDVLGQPTEKRWPGFSELPVAKKLNLAGNKTNYLRSKFPKAAFAGGPTLSDAGFDLLNRWVMAHLNMPWERRPPLPALVLLDCRSREGFTFR